MFLPPYFPYYIPDDVYLLSVKEIRERYPDALHEWNGMVVARLIHYVNDNDSIILNFLHDYNININHTYVGYRDKAAPKDQMRVGEWMCKLQWTWLSLAAFHKNRIEYITPRSIDNNPIRFISVGITHYHQFYQARQERNHVQP